MEKKCIYFTRFTPNKKGNGGDRRAAQLYEVFSFLNPQIHSLENKQRTNKSYFIYLLSVFKNLLSLSGILKKWSKAHSAYANYLHYVSYEWILLYKTINADIVLIDDPIYFFPLVKFLNSKGVPIIAFAHNLESLVPGQVQATKQADLFVKELKLMALCKYVITISKEDTYVLKNFDINTICYPYYPSDVITEELHNVRIIRDALEKKNILLIGTASNIPTLTGMKSVIKAWNKFKLYKKFGRLIVAGYNTDKLKEYAHGENIEFLGTISTKKLYDILSRVKACLCYQDKGSGALTRIPELLIAGVPVIANNHAARSYHNIEGIFEFTTLDQLMNTPDNYFLNFDTNLTPPDAGEVQYKIKKLIGTI